MDCTGIPGVSCCWGGLGPGWTGCSGPGSGPGTDLAYFVTVVTHKLAKYIIRNIRILLYFSSQSMLTNLFFNNTYRSFFYHALYKQFVNNRFEGPDIYLFLFFKNPETLGRMLRTNKSESAKGKTRFADPDPVRIC